ncbi:hypothetical protein [Microcoleus sp.]
MPVPQEINFIVEHASCVFLAMVQDVSKKKESNSHLFLRALRVFAVRFN